MKPDWDKLANAFKNSDVVGIYDVDCTAAGQPLCQQNGVQGYPTIKYWLPGSKSSKDYQGGRDYNGLKSFVDNTFKALCDPFTQKGCNEQEKRYIDKTKDKSKADLEAEYTEKDEELKKLKKERSDAQKEMTEKEKAWKKKETALKKATVILKKFIASADKNDNKSKDKKKNDKEEL